MSTREASVSATLLHAYCHQCDRWRVLDSEALPVDFVAASGQPAEARCPDCGVYGLVKARPSTSGRQAPPLLALEELPDVGRLYV